MRSKASWRSPPSTTKPGTATCAAPYRQQYDLGTREPNIQVWNVNRRGDRTLTLRHTQYLDRPLGDSTLEVLKHAARLWGFGVTL